MYTKPPDSMHDRRTCIPIIAVLSFVVFVGFPSLVYASEIQPERLATAIWHAEGGAETAHPYGILKRYKVTTPRQACLNTIRHAKRDWNGEGDFIAFLGARYAPTVNCINDPTGLNRNWVRNVSYYYNKGE